MNLKGVSLCDRFVALRNSVLILPVIDAFLSSSCIRESNYLGMGFIPSGDKIQSIFTNTIPAYSSLVRLDLFASYEMANALFRSYKDRVFGVATANAVSQISPNDSIFRFGINPNADSVVMRIKYKVIYVNKASAVYFKVYQLQNLYTSTDSIKYWDLIPGKEHS